MKYFNYNDPLQNVIIAEFEINNILSNLVAKLGISISDIIFENSCSMIVNGQSYKEPRIKIIFNEDI